MLQVNLRVARAQLTSIINSKRRTMLTNHGRDVAAIVPPDQARALDILEASGTLQALLDTLPES